jgi:hypothetical protein
MTPTNDEIDYDALLKGADAFNCEIPLIDAMAGAIRALRDQREADARDAGRYQCIRAAYFMDVRPEILQLPAETPEQLDAALDAAMAAMSAQGEK